MVRRSIDGIYRKPVSINIKYRRVKQPSWLFRHFHFLAPLTLGVFIFIMIGAAFAGGALTVLTSQKSLADLTEPDINQDIIPLAYDPSELNVVGSFLPELIQENRHEPTAEEIKAAERKEALKKYFIKKGSPFAKSDATLEAFLSSDNMKLMIAISLVESGMGKHCYYYNCSGIGGYPPNLRKYPNYAAWVEDFDDLLNRRYKGLPIEKFLGYYVQPGSDNWLYGVKQVLAELKQANID